MDTIIGDINGLEYTVGDSILEFSYLLAAVLFIVGLKFFTLDPIAMGLGFVVAQLGFVFLFKGLSKVG